MTGIYFIHEFASRLGLSRVACVCISRTGVVHVELGLTSEAIDSLGCSCSLGAQRGLWVRPSIPLH